MPKKRKTGHIFEKNGRVGFYADLRDYWDVIQKAGDHIKLRMALIPEDSTKPTTDRTVAEKLVADLVVELEGRRRDKALGVTPNGITTPLAAFAQYHLVEKARAGKVTERWLTQAEMMLRAAVEFFGAHTPLASIDVKKIQVYVNHLRTYPNGRGGTLLEGSQRHYLNALSNLFKRALSEGEVQLNPVAALRVDDVSFSRKRIHFPPNQWRSLKTRGSERTIKLWPQLEEILRAYILQREATSPLNELIFPSPHSADTLIQDFRNVLDVVAGRCGWEPGEIRTKAARHSYCAARLQTVEHGYPVAPFTVSRELGHTSTVMVENVYSHLGEIRHRSEVVEFRVENHREALKPKLEALR